MIWSRLIKPSRGRISAIVPLQPWQAYGARLARGQRGCRNAGASRQAGSSLVVGNAQPRGQRRGGGWRWKARAVAVGSPIKGSHGSITEYQ